MRMAFLVTIGTIVGVVAGVLVGRQMQILRDSEGRADLDRAHRIAAVVDILALEDLSRSDSPGAMAALEAQLQFEVAGLSPDFRQSYLDPSRERCQLALIHRYLENHPHPEDTGRVGRAVSTVRGLLPPAGEADSGSCFELQM